MDIRSLSCVFFSPTRTTKAITESIAQGIAAERVAMVDFTKRAQRARLPLTFGDDLVVLAAPVYYGRVAEEAATFLASLSASPGTPAVLVVVYGNRAFDDALRELHDIAVSRGFVPVAGGAFVGEHSYSSSAAPIAQGRPDAADLDVARTFGAAVRGKLRGLKSLKTMPALTVPGQVPYIEPKNLLLLRQARAAGASLTPETDAARCTDCGQCAELCPTGAIDPNDVGRTDKNRCLLCFACVKGCPEAARQMRDPILSAAIQSLRQNCQARKAPELFL